MAGSLFRYVALGDSSAVGVGADSGGGYPERLYQRLKREGVPAGILNLGVSGARSDDVVRGQAQKAATKRPHLVTLGIGGNDLWRLIPASEFRANLETIARALEPTGAAVVVSNVIDLSLAPAAMFVEQMLGVTREVIRQRAEELNACFDVFAGRARFEVVDLFGFSRREGAVHPEYFSPDGFHPSAKGYERWAELMWPAVERAAKAWMGEQGERTG